MQLTHFETSYPSGHTTLSQAKSINFSELHKSEPRDNMKF